MTFQFLSIRASISTSAFHLKSGNTLGLIQILKTGCMQSMVFAVFVRLIACLAAVFLSIGATDSPADASTRSHANAASIAETICAWDCNVINKNSKFGSEMKALISKFRLITVQLKCDQQEDEKCLNHRRNSSQAELWIWLTRDILSQGGQNMSQQSFNNSNNWFRKSLEEQIEVGVSCSLKPATDSNDTNPSLNDVIAMVLMEEVEKFTEPSHSETAFCYKLSAKNGSYVCLNLTTNAAHNMDEISMVTWQKKADTVLLVVILVAVIWYFPLILILFTPTEFKDKVTGRVMIALHGTSPQGIRSWIANILGSYHVANVDVIKWWEMYLFPFLFSISAASTYLLKSKVIDVRFPSPDYIKIIINNSDPLWTTIFLCNFSAFALSFLWRNCCRDMLFVEPGEFCTICSNYENKEVCHDQENPQYYGRNELKMHLRILPFILVKICLIQTVVRFLDCFLCISDLLYALVSSPDASLRQRGSREMEKESARGIRIPVKGAKRALLICLTVLSFPVMLIVFLLMITFNLLILSPIVTITSAKLGKNTKYRKGFLHRRSFFLFMWATVFTFIFEPILVLTSCAILVINIVVGFVTTLRGIFMDLPDILPFAILALVVVFYLWKCYIPYPRKYNKLAITLYKYYKTKIGAGDNQQDQNERSLPKDLYLKARENLMPLQESKAELVMKVIVYMVIIFLIFVFITEAPKSKLNDETKALGTLLASFIPKVVEMLFDKDPELKKADDEDFVKAVAIFVENYYENQNANSSSNNSASAESNESQITSGATNRSDDNDGSSAGTILSNENIPLLSCQHAQYGSGNSPENTIQESTA